MDAEWELNLQGFKRRFNFPREIIDIIKKLILKSILLLLGNMPVLGHMLFGAVRQDLHANRRGGIAQLVITKPLYFVQFR